MALKKKEITKLYYRIGEVAGMFGVNTSLIRFYENEFKIIKPFRNKKGNRLFTQQDVDHFRTIFHLVKEKGYTLDGAKQKMKELARNTSSDEPDMLRTLQRMKAFLLDLREQL